ncbi:hypothetical protein ACIRD6_13365 [Streptomyces sp. NPDC102473]|uniref:hypothetical protein n=1 Tax=Streptomyces sp. NPDC102473 TaxID=3366180 RepID=UPI0037FB79EC
MPIVDIYAAQAATGIPARTIRKRLSRRTLTHHGYDHHRRALVELDELTRPARVKAA